MTEVGRLLARKNTMEDHKRFDFSFLEGENALSISLL